MSCSLLSPGWVKIDGPASAHVKAKILTLENAASQCIGTALVRNDCWSFLKGGFVLNSSSQTSVLYFQVSCDVEFVSTITPAHVHGGKNRKKSIRHVLSCVLRVSVLCCRLQAQTLPRSRSEAPPCNPSHLSSGISTGRTVFSWYIATKIMFSFRNRGAT